MVDGFESHEDMNNSVCDGFVNWVNDVVPDNIELLCNQDGYEILTSAFGRDFRKQDLEQANIEQIRSIAIELGQFLERDVTTKEVCSYINSALKQSFGDFNVLQCANEQGVQ